MKQSTICSSVYHHVTFTILYCLVVLFSVLVKKKFNDVCWWLPIINRMSFIPLNKLSTMCGWRSAAYEGFAHEILSDFTHLLNKWSVKISLSYFNTVCFSFHVLEKQNLWDFHSPTSWPTYLKCSNHLPDNFHFSSFLQCDECVFLFFITILDWNVHLCMQKCMQCNTS